MDEIEGKGSEEGLERINIKVPCRSFFFFILSICLL